MVFLGCLSFRDGGCAVVLARCIVPFSKVMLSRQANLRTQAVERVEYWEVLPSPGISFCNGAVKRREFAKLLEVGLGLKESGDHY